MKDIKRINNVNIPCITKCINCGEELEIYDFEKCCGITYGIEIIHADLVIKNDE